VGVVLWPDIRLVKKFIAREVRRFEEEEVREKGIRG
jgi:hypothetical protein